jgi:hypothetical protein
LRGVPYGDGGGWDDGDGDIKKLFVLLIEENTYKREFGYDNKEDFRSFCVAINNELIFEIDERI